LTGQSRRLPSEIRRRAIMRLRQLDAATCVGDLRRPNSNRLEALSGDREERFSIRINEQWRVCFSFRGVHAYEVEIVDYH
jgi:proteic killer suppression protein